MDKQLLIQVYNVGVGDCIYLRVPDISKNKKILWRHIVIDCGTKDPNRDEQLLVNALQHIVEEMLLPLPGDDQKKQLDLLVITHPHMDHYASFGLESTQALWDQVQVKQLWLNAMMDPNNDKAANARQQVSLANAAIRALCEADIHPVINQLSREIFNLNQGQIAERASDYLTNSAFSKNLKYVDDETPKHKLNIFEDNDIGLHILAPSHDFDAEYLGVTNGNPFAAFNAYLSKKGDPVNWWEIPEKDTLTISMLDFRQLRARMANMTIAMAMAQNEVINNSSIVLLLEWRGYRLLFTGDAECKFSYNGKYRKDRQNFSWNVMAEHHPDLLLKPLDFLKVGHHGSENASPWAADNPHNEVNRILEAIAPLNNEEKKLHAVISAARYHSWPKNIPQRALLEELGHRVVNVRTSYDEWELYQHNKGGNWPQRESERRKILVSAGTPQPPRTDLEHQHTGDSQPVLFIPFTFKERKGGYTAGSKLNKEISRQVSDLDENMSAQLFVKEFRKFLCNSQIWQEVHQLLWGDNEDEGWTAALALGHVQNRFAIPALLERFTVSSDKKWQWRMEALEILEKMNEEEQIEAPKKEKVQKSNKKLSASDIKGVMAPDTKRPWLEIPELTKVQKNNEKLSPGNALEVITKLLKDAGLIPEGRDLSSDDPKYFRCYELFERIKHQIDPM